MSDPQALEADIARQREELAATVDELHRRVEAAKPSRNVLIGVGVATAALVALVIWRRSHTS